MELNPNPNPNPNLKAALDVGGYMECRGVDWSSNGVDLGAISATIQAIKAAGWPPVFIFMYDEVH